MNIFELLYFKRKSHLLQILRRSLRNAEIYDTYKRIIFGFKEVSDSSEKQTFELWLNIYIILHYKLLFIILQTFLFIKFLTKNFPTLDAQNLKLISNFSYFVRKVLFIRYILRTEKKYKILQNSF